MKYRKKHIRLLMQKAGLTLKDLEIQTGAPLTTWDYRISLSDDKDFNYQWAKTLGQILNEDPDNIIYFPRPDQDMDWKDYALFLKKENQQLKEKLSRFENQ